MVVQFADADDALNARLGARDRAELARKKTRPDEVKGVRCMACGRGNFASAKSCRACGVAIPADASPASREQIRGLRNLRERPVRATTVHPRKMKRDLALEAALERALLGDDEDLAPVLARPKTRAECAGVPRPCPFVSCEHHLYLDVSAQSGALKLNFPELEPHEMHPDESCARDIAEQGGATLEEVGRVTNLTRERIRQIEVKALAKLAAVEEMSALRELWGIGSGTKRRLPIVQQDDQEQRDEHEPKADDDFDVAAFAGDELDDDV